MLIPNKRQQEQIKKYLEKTISNVSVNDNGIVFEDITISFQQMRHIIDYIDNREIAIEHAKDVLADLIPYNDSNYERRLQESAEATVDAEFVGEFDELYEEHDRLLDEDKLDEIINF